MRQPRCWVLQFTFRARSEDFWTVCAKPGSHLLVFYWLPEWSSKFQLRARSGGWQENGSKHDRIIKKSPPVGFDPSTSQRKWPLFSQLLFSNTSDIASVRVRTLNMALSVDRNLQTAVFSQLLPFLRAVENFANFLHRFLALVSYFFLDSRLGKGYFLSKSTKVPLRAGIGRRSSCHLSYNYL